MLAPKIIEINGRKYTVNPMNPMDAFDFYHEWVNCVSYGKSLAPLGLKALKHCADEMGRMLSDKDVFEKVFSEHPEDLFVLEEEAREAIIGPFGKKM